MDFGKLATIEAVDFTLPHDAPQTTRILTSATKITPAIYIGCPIWANKEWLGKIYPSSAKEKDYLYHYTRQFNTIELNTTHYRIPDIETIERWKKASARGFTFCPKFPQVISHDNQLEDTEELTHAFCDSIRNLGEHLGISFLQLPPYFMPRQLPVLERFLQNFPKDIDLAVEFRHPDWFKNNEAHKAFDVLEKYKISTVITDVAGRRDVLHQHLTTPAAVIRFVGHGLHPTDYTRIDAWVEKLLQWLEEGLHTLYFFVHEPENTFSPELVSYMINLINKRGIHTITAPRFIPQVIQGSLF
jgi:uncharacterized protein YecE (DUF72 family)